MTVGKETAGAAQPDRPLCLNPNQCAAKKVGRHCRRCTAVAMNTNPEMAARRKAGIRAFHDDPERSAAHKAAAIQNIAGYLERPGTIERLRARMPEVHAKSMTPEVRDKLRASRAERGRKRSATMLAWCPERYRDDYLLMTRKAGIRKVEAKEIILRMVADDDAARIARENDGAELVRRAAEAMQRKHERELASRY